MISVIIPTLNAQAGLVATLGALVPAAAEGIVRQVVVADGGSTDSTLKIADGTGADIVMAGKGRGAQLAAGARNAKQPWLLFLHADTVLETGWEREAVAFMERVDMGNREPAAASFRFALDDIGLAPRVLERLVGLRCALLRLPYGDQGLLIPKRLYEEIGGYRPYPLMEDIDLVLRLKRRQRIMFRTSAVTSALRYRRAGYTRRVLRNQLCLALYALRVPAERIERLYAD